MDWITTAYVLYALGSLCFIAGSIIGLLSHLGVLR